MDPTIVELRAELARAYPLRNRDIAAELGIDDSLLSKILSGSRPMPDGFPEQFRTAVETAARKKAEHLLSIAGDKPAAA